MKAYYFATKERKLQYGDDRQIILGETHSVKGKIKACSNGLHASENILDALSYAPGAILYLVKLSGEMNKDYDKVAAQHRTYLQELDVTEVLKKFARMQALINIKKVKPYCSVEDYKLIIEWLKNGDETLQSAAESAAESAAWSTAAWSAAESTAESAAWSAANNMLLNLLETETGLNWRIS